MFVDSPYWKLISIDFSPAKSFATVGVKAIALIARDLSKLKDAGETIRLTNPGVQVMEVAADITNEVTIEKAFTQIKKQFGSADVLIYNAGYVGHDAKIGEGSLSDYWTHFVSLRNRRFLKRN